MYFHAFFTILFRWFFRKYKSCFCIEYFCILFCVLIGRKILLILYICVIFILCELRPHNNISCSYQRQLSTINQKQSKQSNPIFLYPVQHNNQVQSTIQAAPGTCSLPQGRPPQADFNPSSRQFPTVFGRFRVWN